MLTHPGMGLDWHLKQSQTYYNLMCGGYDAVVGAHSVWQAHRAALGAGGQIGRGQLPNGAAALIASCF